MNGTWGRLSKWPHHNHGLYAEDPSFVSLCHVCCSKISWTVGPWHHLQFILLFETLGGGMDTVLHSGWLRSYLQMLALTVNACQGRTL
jgi:hypothetical protein